MHFYLYFYPSAKTLISVVKDESGVEIGKPDCMRNILPEVVKEFITSALDSGFQVTVETFPGLI